MILFIDDSLVDSIATELNFNIFFQKLMVSYTEGKHIIIISPLNVKKILTTKVLDSYSEIVLNHYSSHNKASLEVLDLFDKIIRIIPNSEKETIYSDMRSKKQFNNINIDRFIDTANFQKTILLGENGNDIQVYAMMAEYHKKVTRKDSFVLSYKSQTGGGSTTVNEYKTIFSTGEEFCLCLLDSDKRTPTKAIGDTAKNVEKHHLLNFNSNFKCNYHVVDVLEIENLLPRVFYLENYEKKDINKKGILNRIESFEKIDSSSYFHIDFKKGLKKMEDYNDDSFKKYWSNLSLGLQPITVDFGDGDYGYFKGYGDKIVVDFLSFEKTEVFKFVDEDNISKKWSEIGKKLSSYIYGTPKVRVI
ncbi:hypothetical protein RT99_19040 [Flavobacterium sp. MEB061]|uniref:hypothetical protein n=1 Tax=Flavobacterium sp. MEB061 TaxID=1587524 RepID=UPI0005AC236A|nr:hypothetical protein [Flavobacterium sp. MEB061]KIQ17234.1 hypothetical protein RT99_19040 [Flavobacterium sp. MEB061]